MPESKNPLDNTAVHPESYGVAKELLKVCGYTESDLKNGNISELEKRVADIGTKEMASKLGTGEETLCDIVSELMRPGRDPRDELPPPMLRKDILDMKDLKEGMELQGTVRNVIDFGAFVDIGVKHDGLVHISELSTSYVKNPSDIVSVGDIVKVKVIGIDTEKQKVKLSMK